MTETFIQSVLEYPVVVTIKLVACAGIAVYLSHLFTDVLKLEMWRKNKK